MIIGLFRTILILVIIYLLVKLVGKVLFPPSSDNSAKNRVKKKEGDVTIYYDNRTNKKIFDQNSGEYVDYEDVDEGKGREDKESK